MFDASADPFANASSSTSTRIYPRDYEYNIGTPGAKHSGRSGQWLLGCFMIIFPLFGLLAFGASIRDLIRNGQLDRTGITVPATVTGSEIDTDDDSTTYYITYQFYATTGQQEGQQFTNTRSVDRAGYNRYGTAGTRIDVRYDPNDPTYSDLAVVNRTGSSVIGIVLGTLFTAVGFGIGWVTLGQGDRQKKFREKGKILTAKVIEHTSDKDSDGDFRMTLKYQFFAPDGKTITRTETTGDTSWAKKPLLTRGATFEVIYVDDRNFRVL